MKSSDSSFSSLAIETQITDSAPGSATSPSSSGPSSSPSSALSHISLTHSWIVFACAVTFYLYEYVLRVSISVLTDDLMRAFSVTSTALGVLASSYYISYVPLQVPCGVIVDRFGPRRVITFSAFLCVVGSAIFAQSEAFWGAQFGRFLMGAGSACAYLSCAKVAAEWFPPSKFALITSITMMMGTFGGMFGGFPFASLTNQVGWRPAMMIAAAVGLAVMALAWLVIRDRPTGYKFYDAAHHTEERAPLLAGLKIVARNPRCWLIGVYGCMMYLPLSAFSELWGVPFLMKLYDIGNQKASLMCALFLIGMGIGCPISAFLSEKFHNRVKLMGYSALGTAICFAIIPYAPLTLNAMCSVLFIAGLISGGQILYFVAAKEINGPSISGTVVGFINGLVMSSGLVFQPFLGKLIDVFWDGAKNSDGTPLYTVEVYQWALASIPICLLISWVIMMFVSETYHRQQPYLRSTASS